MSDVINVLVFGATGVGKTSICNELTGLDKPVSNSAKGVTFECFNFPTFEYRGKKINITDTVGLNESEQGTVSPQNAIEKLIHLMCQSSNGYNLLIHVMKAPRITKDVQDNYEFFVNTLTDNKIPCILVATGCENDENIESWGQKNELTCREMGFEYATVLSTCFQKGGRFEKDLSSLRLSSAKNLKSAIIQYCLSEPVKIYVGENGFLDKVKKAWNWFCKWINKPEWGIGINEKLFNYLLRMKIPEKLAKSLATGIVTLPK